MTKMKRSKIDSIILRKVLNLDVSTLNSPISLEEILNSISFMESDKAPGLDGISVEFFKTNIEWIGPSLLELYNYSVMIGSLGPSINFGLIKLIFKGGDKTLIKN